jgi:starch synthase
MIEVTSQGDKPKIIHMTERYLPAVGGVERHVYEITRRLSNRGLDIHILTTDLVELDPPRRLRDTSREGITRFPAYQIAPLPQGLGFVSPQMIGGLVDADLVHAHGYGRFPTFVAPICRLMKIPVVITPHSGWGRSTFSKALFDAVIPPLSLRWADRIIALSRQEVLYLKSIGVSKNVELIPNGVDLDEFRRVKTKKRSTDAINLLYVGRFDIEQKGLDVALESLKILVDEYHLDAYLTLIGPGTTFSVSFLKSHAERLAISERVILRSPPRREDLVVAFKLATVIVIPSRVDSFPLVLLEGMAAGTPIVASRVGGIPDVLRNGELGYLVEPGNPRSLAEGIRSAIVERSRTAMMVGMASKAVKDYDWDHIVDRIYKLYMSLLKKR